MTFPADYDTLTRVTADDYLDTAGKEGDFILDQIQDAIEATQAAIGKIGETAAGTVEARLAAIPAAIAGAVTAHEVAADPHAQYTTAAEVASLAPAETTTTTGALVAGATDKGTPVDSDLLGLADSAASWIIKKFSWASLKAALLSAVFGAGYSKTVCNVTTPWLYCPSSTVVAGAAGAAYITLGTALPAAITVPGKCYVPAVGSLSAGWYDFSSTTTTQVNLVDAVDTGGAFSATTNVDVTGPSYTMDSGLMGPNGRVRRSVCAWLNNTAGLKTPKVFWGASNVWNVGLSASVTAFFESVTWNRNNPSSQATSMFSTTAAFGVTTINGVNTNSVNTSSDVLVSFTFRLATATDYLCLLRWNEQIAYGA